MPDPAPASSTTTSLDELLKLVDDPLARKRLAAELPKLLEQQKLASLHAFAYGLSHEINNPLANIATRAQTLLADEPHPDRKRRLAVIVAQAFRAHEMLADVMLFAKPPRLNLETVLVFSLLRELVDQFQSEAAAQQTSLMLVPPGDETAEQVAISADPVHLKMGVQAMLRNALEAVAHQGAVTLQLCVASKTIAIVVRDTGPGLSEEAREHLYDPFYSGREAGRGLGLGLSKTWRIAELHGGAIVAENLAPTGCQFTLTLPR